MSAAAASLPAIDVIQPGLLTTVQDSGRLAHRHEGVPVAGAADSVGLAVANILAGNQPEAAGLECTLLGPELRALREVRIGLGGGDLGARLLPSGRPLRSGRAHRLSAGDRLTFDADPAADAAGCRAYVAVEGGLDVPVVLGSRSTSLVGGFGGHDGRPLRAGDVLRAFTVPPRQATPAPFDEWPMDLVLPRPGDPIRVVPGPSLGSSETPRTAFEALLARQWTVSPVSDRRGVRLEGAPIPASGVAEAGSHGMIPGAVQLTPAGLPLVLLPDGGTTGGYPVIGLVISADLGIVGQARPGDRLQFQATDFETAREALANLRATLEAGRARA
jgi:antagonist of KipI